MALSPQELRDVYRRQGDWFAGERSRLLRKIDIAGKCRVLDLGCGSGETLGELERRAGGLVLGADCDLRILRLSKGRRLGADGTALPFAEGSFDLVFTQMFFMWAKPESALPEIRRVLQAGGHLIVCAEPDYGGAIEHPPGAGETAQLAEELGAEGADVEVGRRLGGELRCAGFEVSCGLHPAAPLVFGDDSADTQGLEERRDDLEFLYIPYFWFLAKKRTS